MISAAPLTELESLLPAYQRRLTDADRHFINSTNCNDAGIDLIDQHLAPEAQSLTVCGHHAWREGISSHARNYDEVDELVEEIRRAEFEGRGARP